MAELGTEYDLWVIGWLIAGAVVVVAAALLVWILLTAWSLERHTGRALQALRRIEANTKPIWALSSAADRLDQVEDESQAIENALAQAAARPPARSPQGAAP